MNTVTQETKAQMVDKKEEPSSEKAIQAFLETHLTLGDSTKIHKVDTKHVFDNFYRVNIWIKKMTHDSVVPTFCITHSFFLEIEDGVAYDRTLRQEK